MESRGRLCELCGGDAALYCPSDSAFLCFSCDADVHGANFLVARHIRHPVCSSCRSLSLAVGARFSGPGIAPHPVACPSCSGERSLPEADDSDSLSSESDCVSSTGSAAAAAPAKIRLRPRRKLEVDRMSSLSSLTDDSARFVSGEVSSSAGRAAERGVDRNRTSRLPPAVSLIDKRAEGILEIWLRRLGLSDSSVVDWAARALGSCGGQMTAALPLRVLLAASFWLGLRMRGGWRRDSMPPQVLIRRLEEVSGVPAKLIVAAAANVARAGRVRRAGRDLEEGCAEC